LGKESKRQSSLVTIQRNDVFTNSWVIAENIGRQHKQVTRVIEKFKDALSSEGFGELFSSPVRGTKTRGQERKVYDLNEQQAFFLMTLFDNNPRVVEFKKHLALSFVAMRKLLLEKQTADWQQTRLQSKQIRLHETDAIKALIEYAKGQGSQNADRLYIVYTKLVKQISGYDSRDLAGIDTLTEILTFERLLSGIITSEMLTNTHYKEIYKRAKVQLLEIKRLWAMPKLLAG